MRTIPVLTTVALAALLPFEGIWAPIILKCRRDKGAIRDLAEKSAAWVSAIGLGIYPVVKAYSVAFVVASIPSVVRGV